MRGGHHAECGGFCCRMQPEDNIFAVKGQKLGDPSLYAGALYGITRGVVMDLARSEVWP